MWWLRESGGYRSDARNLFCTVPYNREIPFARRPLL
jgi:hypothetical protein